MSDWQEQEDRTFKLWDGTIVAWPEKVVILCYGIGVFEKVEKQAGLI